MKKSTRSDAAAISAQAQATWAYENTPMSDVIQALASGQVTDCYGTQER